MAYYYMAEANDLNNEGERIKYPRLVHAHQIDTKSIAKQIDGWSSFSEGDVIGLLAAISDVLSQELSMGHSVKLDGIGTFTAGLGLKEGVEREQVDGEKKLNAQSIEVRKIHFKADNELLQKTNLSIRLERVSKKQHPVTSTKEERAKWLKEYLTENKVIKIKEYATMTGLSRTSASRELRAMNKAGELHARGSGAHSYYTLPDPSSPHSPTE